AIRKGGSLDPLADSLKLRPRIFGGGNSGQSGGGGGSQESSAADFRHPCIISSGIISMAGIRNMANLSRRTFLGLAAAKLARPAPPETKLNFIIILIDDMGWTDLGSFGSSFYQTPNVDRLVSQGMKFTNAYAACPVCSPSRAAIMTGKYPARLHLTDWIPG